MLRETVQLKMSEYEKLYDIVVAKEHILRRIKDEIDFSFVNPMLKNSYCERFGRPVHCSQINGHRMEEIVSNTDR